MKLTIIRIVVLTLVLALCAAFALAEPMEGGWNNVPCVAAELPEYAQAAFDKALDGLVGTKYTPAALLSTQVVAGMNYCILCQITPVVPDATPTWALVYIYADLQGNAEITNVYELYIDRHSTPADWHDFLKALQTNIATVIKQGDTLSPEVIDERLRELQKELVKMANQKDDYDAIADEILRLRDMRKQAEVDSVVKDEQMRLIQDLQDFIHQQPTTITEFDETLVKRLITKITVFEDHFTIDFKSGVTIDIEA